MGTGAAILALDGHIEGEFIVMSGDDIYDRADIIELIKHTGYATLCKRVENPELFGIFMVDTDGRPTGIIEKPTEMGIGNLASIGNHKLDSRIFEILRTLPLSPR